MLRSSWCHMRLLRWLYFLPLNLARDDWLPETAGERAGRESCLRRFKDTDFAADSFRSPGLAYQYQTRRFSFLFSFLEPCLTPVSNGNVPYFSSNIGVLNGFRNKWLEQENKLARPP